MAWEWVLVLRPAVIYKIRIAIITLLFQQYRCQVSGVRKIQRAACDEPIGRESFDPELTTEGLFAGCGSALGGSAVRS